MVHDQMFVNDLTISCKLAALARRNRGNTLERSPEGIHLWEYAHMLGTGVAREGLRLYEGSPRTGNARAKPILNVEDAHNLQDRAQALHCKFVTVGMASVRKSRIP